jgi:hypothetical protein
MKDRLRAALLALRKNPRRNHLRFYCRDPAKFERKETKLQTSKAKLQRKFNFQAPRKPAGVAGGGPLIGGGHDNDGKRGLTNTSDGMPLRAA